MRVVAEPIMNTERRTFESRSDRRDQRADELRDGGDCRRQGSARGRRSHRGENIPWPSIAFHCLPPPSVTFSRLSSPSLAFSGLRGGRRGLCDARRRPRAHGQAALHGHAAQQRLASARGKWHTLRIFFASPTHLPRISHASPSHLTPFSLAFSRASPGRRAVCAPRDGGASSAGRLPQRDVEGTAGGDLSEVHG